MHIWTIENWKKSAIREFPRGGLRLRFDRNVDENVKKSCKEFAKWLRREYIFPVRIPIYIKSTYRLKSHDGELVVGIFFEPDSFTDEPYISIATGDFKELELLRGYDNAIASILFTLSHELTHYYQWINQLQLTERGRERQAEQYSKFIVYEYASTREHP